MGYNKMEKSEMLTYADIGDFLKDRFHGRMHFYGFEEGIIISDWDYSLSTNDDILRFLLQKYPVAISSKLHTAYNTVQIKFRDDWGK